MLKLFGINTQLVSAMNWKKQTTSSVQNAHCILRTSLSGKMKRELQYKGEKMQVAQSENVITPLPI